MNAPRRKFIGMAALLATVALASRIVYTAPAEVNASVAVAVPYVTGAMSPSPDGVTLVSHVAAPPVAMSVAALAELAASDPMKLAELGRERYEREIRSYSCVFLKQERIDGTLTPVQEIQVRYRDQPLSVYMTWLRNPDQCRRALYVAGRHVDRNGNQQALVEPNGAIVRLFVRKTRIAIHGARSKKASRRTIDQFGFKSTLNLLTRYNRVAEKRGVLKMMYEGEGTIDGRPTFKVARHLPYTGPDSEFPDARMVIHFDQEWLLPVAVYSWADQDEKRLLGSYVITQVRLNPGYSDSDFEF